MSDMVLASYGKAFMLTAAFGHGLVVAVLIALLIAVLVGVVLWVLPPTKPYAGGVAVVVFVILLLLALI